MRIQPGRMPSFVRFLVKHGITIHQLSRATERKPNSICNSIRRGMITLEACAEYKLLFELEGLAIPPDLFVRDDGVDLSKPTRTLRRLSDGEVIGTTHHHPAVRERRVARYISPSQLDPRKEPRMARLTAEAYERFGFQREPFFCDMNSVDDVLETKEHKQALRLMERAVANRDLLIITGEIGSGKTTILNVFEKRLRKNVVLIKPRILAKEKINSGSLLDSIIHDISGELGTREKRPITREAKSRHVFRLLQSLAQQQKFAAIVIDEGHRLPKAALKDIKVLHETMEEGFQRLLSIIVIGQNEMVPLLRDPNIREFADRCGKFQMRGLNGNTKQYLAWKLKRAGVELTSVFDAAAIEEIEKVHTQRIGDVPFGPYPLQLGAFCTLCINQADDVGADRVSVRIVDMIRPLTSTQGGK